MKTECPNCRDRFEIEPEMIGKQTLCQKCGKPFKILRKYELPSPKPEVASAPPSVHPDRSTPTTLDWSASSARMIGIIWFALFMLEAVALIGRAFYSISQTKSGEDEGVFVILAWSALKSAGVGYIGLVAGIATSGLIKLAQSAAIDVAAIKTASELPTARRTD